MTEFLLRAPSLLKKSFSFVLVTTCKQTLHVAFSEYGTAKKMTNNVKRLSNYKTSIKDKC